MEYSASTPTRLTFSSPDLLILGFLILVAFRHMVVNLTLELLVYLEIGAQLPV